MKYTLLIKVALCAAILLTSTGANAASKDFKKLAKIDGVEHVHIGKFLLNLAAKGWGKSRLWQEYVLRRQVRRHTQEDRHN